MLGGSVAVAQNRSINTLPSTTSPTNTTKQTKSMLPSKATRPRPLSEPRATPSRRRVRKFHTRTRSLCSSIGTVVSIRNVACLKLDSTPSSASLALIVPRTVDRKFEQMRATTPATAGHLARSKASHSGISGRRPLRSSACTASRVGQIDAEPGVPESGVGVVHVPFARASRRCRRGRAMAVLRLITSANRMFVSSSRRPSHSAYLTSANTLKGAGFRVCARPAATTWPRRRAAWRDQPRN